MKIEYVTVYDSGTKQFHHIPKCELAAGMAKVRIKGMDGEYWVRASEIETPTIFKHPPFDGELKKAIEEIQECLSEARPLSYQEWEDGFRSDTNPGNEIAIWLKAARKYRELTMKQYKDPNQKRDVFRILGGVLVGGDDAMTIVGDLECIGKTQAEEIFEYLRDIIS